MKELEDLRSRLQDRMRPDLAKALPPCLRERCEDHAARAFRCAVETCKLMGISERQIAEIMTRASRNRSDGKPDKIIDHRQVADWKTGARDVPLTLVLTLPARAVAVFFNELAEVIDEGDVYREGQRDVA